MPESLFEQIQHLANVRRKKPADAVVEVLEAALQRTIPALADERLPQEPILSEEICAPGSIPRPVGERIVPVEVLDYIPLPHDAPDAE
jgi:hypothetical protein